jgi:drug/metabolite transporter (DMT)-like permease
VILVQPVVAAGLGWLWLGESLGPVDVLFATLVLGGILICRRQ